MGIREEMSEEDTRYRSAIREECNRSSGEELQKRLQALAEESKNKQRELFAKYHTSRRAIIM